MLRFMSVLFMLFIFDFAWAAEKFVIEDNILIYDTVNVADESAQWIAADDPENLKAILLEHQSVTIIQLNSHGGSVGASYAMADLIIDFGLHTHVDGICESACTTLFLAGEKRTIQKGSKLGFHRSSWYPEDLRDYYHGAKEDMGWGDEFEFTAYIYGDSQEEIFKDMEYLLERGVEPLFAIKTMRAESEEMWYPRRKQLEQANVIRE